MKKTIFVLSLFVVLFLFACGPASTVDPNSGPQPGDFVEAHVVGSLEDGTVFVDTYEIGQPMFFPYGQELLFPAWDGMFAGLEPGMTASHEIAPEDGFGSEGFGQVGSPSYIPPDSTLLFEVELVNILNIDYEEVEAGSGPTVEPGQTVRVHYTGTLEDGTQFDSSVERDQPFEFVVGQGMVIPGWDIGLQKMNVGTKAILTIPPALAYGAQGSPPVIPPDSTLIFEVELLEILGQ